MKVLITGGAGFIGSATAKLLMKRGDQVVIIDNFNDYYTPQLKEDRISIFLKDFQDQFVVYRGDIRDLAFLETVFEKEHPDKVIHLAAMAGVRYSLEHPEVFADVNVVGTTNLLSMAVKHKVKNFLYASTSSVYGNNQKQPFAESDRTDTPLTPYAASKKATELMAYVYSHLYALPTTGLRFFTVYGPWGRPDMGVFKFVENIILGKTIQIFNHGMMRRNFTYIDDIASGIVTVLDADLPCEIMNIGGDKDEALLDYISQVEKHSGQEAKREMMPMQAGDMEATVADISKLRKLGWAPTTRIDVGIKNFVDWYKEYFGM